MITHSSIVSVNFQLVFKLQSNDCDGAESDVVMGVMIITICIMNIELSH
jgi:hypothetical protein